MASSAKSHQLLSTPDTNLTCQSSPRLIVEHLANQSGCRLLDSELRWELALTFYSPLALCCTGFLLNLVNFCVLRKPQFDGQAYKYMAAIALVDAAFLLVYTLYVSTAQRCEAHSSEFPCSWLPYLRFRYYLSAASVYFTSTLNFTLQTVCAWLSVVVGIERYLAMRSCQLHRASNRCHGSAAATVIVVVVVVCVASLALNLPNSFALRTADLLVVDHDGDNDTARLTRTIVSTEFGKSSLYSGYSIVKLVASSLLPALLLAVTNSALLVQVLSLRRKNIRRKNTGYSGRATKIIQATQQRLQAQRNLTILLIAVIFVFLCGQVPRSLLFKEVFSLLYNGCPCGSAFLWICCPTHRRLHPICELIYLLCLNLNFFIYLGLNEHFRGQVKLAVSFICCGAGTQGRQSNANKKPEEVKLDDGEDADIDLDLFSAAGGTTIGCSQTPSQPNKQQSCDEDIEECQEEAQRLVVSEL